MPLHVSSGPDLRLYLAAVLCLSACQPSGLPEDSSREAGSHTWPASEEAGAKAPAELEGFVSSLRLPDLPSGALPPTRARANAPAVPAAAQSTPWTVQVVRATPLLRPDSSTCLQAGSSTFSVGQTLPVLATDGAWFLVDEDGGCVRASDVLETSRPDPLPAADRSGVVVYATSSSHYDAAGCPQKVGDLPMYTPVKALARSFDANYHGNVVISRDLQLAPVRHVNAEGWVYPWHSSVQLIKPVQGGFIVGGAVLIGPHSLLTARHMHVDSTWCYSRATYTGDAWYSGNAVCDNVAGPAQEDPDGVDAAIVTLLLPELEPFAQVRQEQLAVGEAFYSSTWSALQQNALADSTVSKVGHANAFCLPWPEGSSFTIEDAILQGGDSGGPAWVGDELVGIVHGTRCYKGLEKVIWQHSGEPAAQVLVDVPGIYDFLEPVLP